MKKALGVILAITMILGTVSVVFATDKMYTDVKSTNWAYPAIKAMSEIDIVKGYPDGSFKPSAILTYGEFIKMTLIADKSKDKEWKDPGNAIDETGKIAMDPTTGQKKHWSQNYYEEALKLNYFTPMQISASQLGSRITRADMALVVSSALGEVKIESYDKIQNGIKDVTAKTKNEYDIIKSYATGVLTGYEDNTFKPEGLLTRAESAVVIHRLVDESKRVMPGTTPKEENTGKPSDIILNIDSFINPGDGSINQDLIDAKSYTIITDATPYHFVLKENRGTKWVKSVGLDTIFLMKDGKITELLGTSPSIEKVEGIAEPVLVSNSIYETDITKADYIVSLRCSTDEMLLIVNPFKK